MAASVYGGSPAHHNRIVHNSNGLSNAHNQIMSNGLSHAHMQFYHDPPPAHYLQHANFSNAIKHSTAISSVFAAHPMQQQQQQQQLQQDHHQIPPQLPKKTRKNYRTISSGTLVHSGMFNDPQHFMRNTKRKSAVELLAESKPYYVKSENVLDKKQQLQYQSTRTQLATKAGSTVISPNACKF